MRKLFSLFTKKREIPLKAIGKEISHELKTPLVTIKAGISGIKDCLDKLIQTYQIASEHHLVIPEILPQEIQSLKEALTHCEKEIYYASHYINILTANLTIEKYQPENFIRISIKECIKKAFYAYPYRTQHQKMQLQINFDFNDFVLMGEEIHIIQVFSSLLKIALHYIGKIGDGILKITTATNNSGIYNEVILNILGKQSKEKTEKNMNTFYNTLEFSYCYHIMRAIKGNITCHFVNDQNIQFILSFPKI